MSFITVKDSQGELNINTENILSIEYNGYYYDCHINNPKYHTPGGTVRIGEKATYVLKSPRLRIELSNGDKILLCKGAENYSVRSYFDEHRKKVEDLYKKLQKLIIKKPILEIEKWKL